jgi:hypothetical protein
MVNLVDSSIDIVHHDLRVLTEGGSLEGTVVVRVIDSSVEIAVSGHSSFLVVEPLAGNLVQVSRGHVTDPGGSFCSVDYAI